MLVIFFYFLFFLSPNGTNIQNGFPHNDPVHSYTLIFFTGSDWCPNCIRFEKNILSTKEFNHFIQTELYFIHADFPQAKTLDAPTIERNELLAARYNPQGLTPYFILVKKVQESKKEYVSEILYKNESPDAFILKIKSYMK